MNCAQQLHMSLKQSLRAQGQGKVEVFFVCIKLLKPASTLARIQKMEHSKTIKDQPKCYKERVENIKVDWLSKSHLELEWPYQLRNKRQFSALHKHGMRCSSGSGFSL